MDQITIYLPKKYCTNNDPIKEIIKTTFRGLSNISPNEITKELALFAIKHDGMNILYVPERLEDDVLNDKLILESSWNIYWFRNEKLSGKKFNALFPSKKLVYLQHEYIKNISNKFECKELQLGSIYLYELNKINLNRLENMKYYRNASIPNDTSVEISSFDIVTKKVLLSPHKPIIYLVLRCVYNYLFSKK